MKLYTCTVCKKKKQPSEFYSRKNGKVCEYKCKLCLQEKRKNYSQEEYEKVRKCNRKAVSEFQKRNPDKGAAKTAQYNSKRQKALPKWVDKIELARIRSLYKMARHITKQTGTRHEVDHIVPINSKKVCGLHTIYNLQILSKDDNLRKSNLFEDIVCTTEKSVELK